MGPIETASTILIADEATKGQIPIVRDGADALKELAKTILEDGVYLGMVGHSPKFGLCSESEPVVAAVRMLIDAWLIPNLSQHLALDTMTFSVVRRVVRKTYRRRSTML